MIERSNEEIVKAGVTVDKFKVMSFLFSPATFSDQMVKCEVKDASSSKYSKLQSARTNSESPENVLFKKFLFLLFMSMG
jgi:hypothetical protein